MTVVVGLLKYVVAIFLLFGAMDLSAQNLEPRRWTHLPINTNFIGIGMGNSQGDILLDPALQIEDGKMDAYFLGATYIRSFNLLGKTARIEASLPYVYGRWDGKLRGEIASTRRHGFSDPSIRFSVNLLGSPPLQGKEFAAFRAANPIRTLLGVAVDVNFPVGEYYPDRLINLGGNRYVIRPQIGLLHQHNKWEFESTASVFLYSKNTEFFGGSTREQDPLWFLQAHVNYSFRPGIWAGFGAGYGYGGNNTINGVEKNDEGRVRFWAGSFGMPLSQRQSVKITYARSQTNTRTGSDLSSIIASWSLMF